MSNKHNFKAEDYPQVFRISSEIWDAMDLDDVEATINDMRKGDLCHPPMPKYAIEVGEKFIDRLMAMVAHRQKWEAEKESYGFGLFIEFSCPNYPHLKEINFKIKRLEGKYVDDWEATAKEMLVQKIITQHKYDTLIQIMTSLTFVVNSVLICLLATRNTTREQKIDKNMVQGKVNGTNKYRKDFPVTTTLRIGKITETLTSEGGGGWKVRPHLRRGHLRSQFYGPNRELHRQIFIAPVFVNADEGWIAERKAYNVSVGHGRVQKQKIGRAHV